MPYIVATLEQIYEVGPSRPARDDSPAAVLEAYLDAQESHGFRFVQVFDGQVVLHKPERKLTGGAAVGVGVGF